ncbi:MAG TPA: copper chaperone PCu(A)C, partial [Nakamurella multipartita]|nr:copper chaperone PCu(A)C [Nakamurella multipartita]
MNSRSTTHRAARWTLAAGAASLLLVAGCAATSSGSPSTSSPSMSSTSSSTAAGEVTIADTWVRATPGTDDPSMSAAFGVLTNHTDRQLTVVSATNSASDRTELHEMAMVDGAMVMRPISGGITIPAGGSTTLEPGGLHVMLLNLTTPIEPGDEVDLTLTLDDGSTVPFTAVAKEFAGA